MGTVGEDEGADPEELGAAIVAGAADVAAAMAAWLALVARFDRAEGWRAFECTSCAAWLNWRCGIALSTARQHVFTARALETLPVIAAAFGRGELSYSKVRALVRMATPDTEAELLEVARVATGEHLARMARAYEQAKRDPDRVRPPSVDVGWADDGDMVVRAKLPPDVGLTFLRAMGVAAKVLAGEPQPTGDAHDRSNRVTGDEDEAGLDARADAADSPPPEPPPSPRVGGEQRVERRRVGMVAAFEAVAQLALAGAGDAAASPPPPELLVTVAAHELITTDEAGPEEPLPGRRGLTPEMVRRLACDATTATLLHDHRGSPIDLGRRRRTVNHAQQVALHHRAHGTCEFASCGHERFLHAHHIVHWADGGPTDLDNLVLLCSHHHRLLHHGRYGIRIEADRTRTFHHPDGTPIPTGPTPPDPGHRHRLPAATASLEPRWDGQPLDLTYTIDALIHLEEMAARRAEHQTGRDAAASPPDLGPNDMGPSDLAA